MTHVQGQCFIRVSISVRYNRIITIKFGSFLTLSNEITTSTSYLELIYTHFHLATFLRTISYLITNAYEMYPAQVDVTLGK